MGLSRRSFFGAVTTAAAAAGAGTASTANAAAGNKGKLLRIGVVTCHPAHHHIPNIWGPLIQGVHLSNGVKLTRMTGMEMTHIWDYDPVRVESFCAQFGTEPVKRYDDMTDKVDGVIISDMRNADYFPELAEPYLKAGVPILFNRPFTSSVGRAKRIVEASKKYGTPIMTASGWEYANQVYAMRRKLKEWGPEIRAVTAFNSSAEITHDVHGVWIIAAMLGSGIESVSVIRGEKSVYEYGTDTWTIKYGAREGCPPFYATLHNTSDHDSNCWVKVVTPKGTFEQSLWYLGDTEIRYQHYFLPPLLEFQRMIERGTMPQPHDVVLEKTAAFLAGFKSHLEYGGLAVKLSDLEDDFTVRSDADTIPYPAGYFD